MQTGLQDVSALLGGTQGVAPGLMGGVQAAPSGDFLATLQTSFQALLQPAQTSPEALTPSRMLADLKALLDQQMAKSGNTAPPPAADEELDIKKFITRLQALLDNKDTAVLVSPQNTGLVPTDTPPPLAAGVAQSEQENQLLAERRRLAERLTALTEIKAGVGREPPEWLDKSLPAQLPPADAINKESAATDWLRQLYSTQAKTGLEYGEAGLPREQASVLAESRNILSALTAAAGESRLAADSPDTALSLAGLAHQAKPLTSVTGGDARPVPMQSFIPTPLQDPQWQTDFSQRVSFIARNGNQVAEIRLNPANLGPIDVRVVMNDDQATITFSSQHGVVRDAIEASLPRLREMFSSSGMQLADAQVSDQSLPDQQQSRQGQEHGTAGYAPPVAGAAAGMEGAESTLDLSHIQTAADLRGIDLFV